MPDDASPAEDTLAADPPVAEYDDGFNLSESPTAVDAPPQVPAYIAIIRIVAVLGMGLSMSFGLFLMLAGLRGVLIGVPIFLLAVPFYYGMRLAERLVPAPESQDGAGPEDVAPGA